VNLSLFILASGSRGNALVVSNGAAKIMIDCGLGVRILMPLLQSAGIHAKDLNAVLITHEHADHMRGLERFLNHTRAELYATEGTLAAIDHAVPARTKTCTVKRDAFEINGVEIRAIPVPHDANEPVAYHLTIGPHHLTVATDLGEVTGEIHSALKQSTITVFESNHDEGMLENGSYPAILKSRIRSDTGHLSNRQCAAALQSCKDTELTTVILAHLSDENNDPALARVSAEAALDGQSCDLYVTRQGVTGPFLRFDSNSNYHKGQLSCEPLSLFS
jgi:phosphoribosyl 1,2-cyclic phosphodiesterase